MNFRKIVQVLIILMSQCVSVDPSSEDRLCGVIEWQSFSLIISGYVLKINFTRNRLTFMFYGESRYITERNEHVWIPGTMYE